MVLTAFFDVMPWVLVTENELVLRQDFYYVVFLITYIMMVVSEVSTILI